MKKIYTLVSILVLGWGSMAQAQRADMPKVKEKHFSNPALSILPQSMLDAAVEKAITTTFTAPIGYVSGTTMAIQFNLELTNSDQEYGDSLALIFPPGMTPVTGTDPISSGGGGTPEALNPVSGQTISWGNNDNNYGGIQSATPHTFIVTVTIAGTVSGNQIINYHVSGDGFGGAPADENGTITIAEVAANDLGVTGGNFTPNKFLQMPFSQINGFGSFAADLTNYGSNDVVGETVSLVIVDQAAPTVTVASDAFTTGTITGFGGTATATYTSTFTPTTPALYQAYFISNLANDADTTNDIYGTNIVSANDSVLSPELGANANSFGNAGYEFAQKIEVYNQDTVTSISVDAYFVSAGVDSTIQFHIVGAATTTDTTGSPVTTLASTIAYTITAADTAFNADTTIKTMTLSILGGAILAPGSYYIYYDNANTAGGLFAADYVYNTATSYVRSVSGGITSGGNPIITWTRVEQFGLNLTHSMRANFGSVNLGCNLSVTTSQNNVTTAGMSNGDATATAVGGQGTITYAWSNGASAAAATNLATGVYTVTVTDDIVSACTATATVTITEPTAATCNVSATASVVSNATTNGGSEGSATVAVTGGQSTITYMWSNNSTASAITGLTAGTYTVTVMDNVVANCSATSSVTVTEPAAAVCSISVSVAGSDVTTVGGSNGSAAATATGTQGTITYLWSNGTTSFSNSNLTAGVYTVTVMDDVVANCTAVGTVTIGTTTVAPGTCLLSTTASTIANVTTNGGSNGSAGVAVLGGQSTITYAWSNGNATATATGLTAGVYTVTVNDAVSTTCTSASSVTITEPAAATCNLSASASSTNVSTNGGSNGTATVIALGAGSGIVTYVWSNTATTSVINGLVAGTYTVTVNDDSFTACNATATVTITEPGGVSCNIGAAMVSTNATTNGGSEGTAGVTATGAQGTITYVWSNTAATTSVSGLTAGVYTVTVMDDVLMGCQATGTVTITEPNAITCQIAVSTVTGVSPAAVGGNDGSATVSISGVQGTITYAWSTTPAQTGVTATGLATGTYTVTVMDDVLMGCQATGTVTITDPLVNGISTIDAADAFKVYPNPNNGTFVVEITNANNAQIIVRNVIGQVVYSNTTNDSTTSIDVQNVELGMYFVTVINNNVERTEKIIIK